MKKNEVNIEQKLLEKFKLPESRYDGKLTKTSQFMLNSISLNILNKHINKYFENAFLGDREFQHSIDRPIFVLFKSDKNDKDWIRVFDVMCSKKEYVLDYYCGQNPEGQDLTMIVYQVPEEFSEDYYNFKKGKYSKFSENYKRKFNEKVINTQGREVESIIWGIIHKSPKMVKEVEEEFDVKFEEDDEIWERPRRFREYYREKALSKS